VRHCFSIARSLRKRNSRFLRRGTLPADTVAVGALSLKWNHSHWEPMTAPFVVAIDVGSPKSNRLGWAAGSEHGDASTYPSAVDRLAARLLADGGAAIGFEAPLWAPRRERLIDVTGARGDVERKLGKPWTAGAGPTALATCLGIMTWTFARVADAAPGARATCKMDRGREHGGLLLWEAGTAKLKTHADDAEAALNAFMSRWPDLRSDISAEPAVNLAVAAAMSAGLSVEPDEIGIAAIVIAAA
jgi:hypothetical protein